MYCKKICVNRNSGKTSCQIISICKLLDDINKKLNGLMNIPLTQQAVITDIIMHQNV